MTLRQSVRRSGPVRALGAAVAVAVGLAVAPLGPEDVQDLAVGEVRPVVAAQEAPAPEAPSIRWQPCRDGFECAAVPVPLDYDRPQGATVDLALIRLPAAGDPSRRIGSLFVNPGGPGGSGVDVVRGVGQFLPLEIRGRYDLVGFDPRGVMRSTPVRCFESLDEVFPLLPSFAFPVTEEEEDAWLASDRAVADACTDRAGAIVDHMATADVARDLDLLRRAVGDAELNFLGFSYGSYLGVTYANMFPDSVGALVVDGVLDPVAWSTGRGDEAAAVPFSTRLRSDQGTLSTFREVTRLCDEAGDDCAFSGDARERYDALAERARREPIRVEDEFGTFVVTYADLVATTIGAMYAPQVWGDFAAFLAQLEEAVSSERLRASLAALRAGLGADLSIETEYPNVVEGFPGVACSDSDNPDDPDAWRRAADEADARSPYFGRPWTWFSSICAVWPGEDEDRYTGPWTAETSSTVLVVGNHHDPATRYAGARTVADLLPNSRLLTYTGWGHTAFLRGSFCVDSAVTRYLVDGAVPAAGATCEPPGSPFGPLGPEARAAAAALRPLVLPEDVRRALEDVGAAATAG